MCLNPNKTVQRTRFGAADFGVRWLSSHFSIIFLEGVGKVQMSEKELEEKIAKVFSVANDMLEIAGVDLKLSKLHLERSDKIKNFAGIVNGMMVEKVGVVVIVVKYT